MYKTIAGALMLFAGEALAHQSHGAPEIHLHSWEYVLLAAVIAVAALFAMRW